MPNSARFVELRQRLGGLRRHMLPKTFSPTGTYSAREIDRARGYRLLVHAELEAFLEDISWAAVQKKISEWHRSRTPSDLVICFLAAYHSSWVDPESGSPSHVSQATRKRVKDAVSEAITEAMRQYRQIVDENHGVREANLKRLLLPVGVRFGDLDATWVTDMDDFGRQRGEVAHTTVGVQRPLDPKSEYLRVVELLKGLKKLDSIIVQIAR